jgi:hypothetical protein
MPSDILSDCCSALCDSEEQAAKLNAIAIAGISKFENFMSGLPVTFCMSLG